VNKTVSETLKEISALKNKKDRVAALRQHNDYTTRTVLQGAFDDRVIWQLPEGDVPYKKNTLPDLDGVIHTEARKLYLFVYGGNPNLTQLRREALFIEFLENLDAGDAEMVAAMKDKKLPPSMKGITVDVVREAFPKLLGE